MKKTICVLALLVLSACAEGGKIRQDLNRMEQSLNDIRGFQAEHTTQISEMQNQIRALSGRLDEIQHTESSRIGSDLTTLRDDLSNLKRRVPPPPIVPVSALEADEVLAGSLPPETGKLFSDALQEVRQGSFSGSVPMLRSALDQSYGRDWSANILFWLGVSYDGLSDNRNALASYNEIISKYSRHSRTPLALFRQAAVFVRLGDTQTAKLTLKKLISDYPKSPEVSAAKERLKTL